MTPAALLATLARLHLTPPEAAWLLGYHKRTVYRWLAGRAAVPPCVERVLWVCEHAPGLVRHLFSYPQEQTGDKWTLAVMASPQQGMKP